MHNGMRVQSSTSNNFGCISWFISCWENMEWNEVWSPVLQTRPCPQLLHLIWEQWSAPNYMGTYQLNLSKCPSSNALDHFKVIRSHAVLVDHADWMLICKHKPSMWKINISIIYDRDTEGQIIQESFPYIMIEQYVDRWVRPNGKNPGGKKELSPFADEAPDMGIDWLEEKIAGAY